MNTTEETMLGLGLQALSEMIEFYKSSVVA